MSSYVALRTFIALQDKHYKINCDEYLLHSIITYYIVKIIIFRLFTWKIVPLNSFLQILQFSAEVSHVYKLKLWLVSLDSKGYNDSLNNFLKTSIKQSFI